MSRLLIQLILRNRLWILLFSFGLLGFSLYSLPNARLVSDFEIFFKDDNPDLQAYHEMQDTYSAANNILFVISPKNKNVFTNDTLIMVQSLTESAWQLPHSLRVDSLTNYQHTRAEGDDLIVRNLVEKPGQLSSKQLDNIRNIAINEPTLYKRLIRDGDVTGVNVTFNLVDRDRNVLIPEIMEHARALADEYRQQYPRIEIRLTGQLVNNTAFRESSLHDIKTIVPLAFMIALICIAGYMWFSSRSVLTTVTGTFSVFTIIVFSILTAQGISIWMDIPITPPVANAPTMILTLAIADSIHILVSYFQHLRKGTSKQQAMQESLSLNFQPVLMTSLTTTVGFLSLNFSDSPPFQDLGNIVAIGVVAAWFYSITLLPALMTLLPTPMPQANSDAEQEHGKWISDFVIKHYRRLLAASLVVICATSAMIPMNTLNDVWSEYFAESTVQRQSGDYLRDHLTTVNRVSYSLGSGESNGIADPEYLRKVDEFADWLRQHPFVYHVYSFTDILKRINKNMHGDDEAWYRLPENRQLAAQYLLMYEMSLPFGLDLTNQINLDKSASKLTVTVNGSSTKDLLAFQQDAKRWLEQNAPAHMYHPGAGGDTMFAHIGQHNIRSMLFGTILALVIISALIAIMLRSSRYGLISLFPNLAPAAIAFGLWGLFNGQIGLSLSAVIGMTLGIVVDYTVHFLSKYLRAKRENNLNTVAAVRYAFSTVGEALVVTTIILVANFSVLAMSTFRLNSDMGLMTAIMILIALLVDFFLLAPLMLALSSSGKTTSPTSSQTNETGEQVQA